MTRKHCLNAARGCVMWSFGGVKQCNCACEICTKSADLTDAEILKFLYDHSELSPRECAAYLGVPKERVHDILRSDLAEILRGAR